MITKRKARSLGMVTRVLAALVLASAAYAQTPQERDLVLGPKRATTSSPPSGVPRGYALIIGISRYQNLGEAQQLQFPESDALAIRGVLTNTAGGAFPAENVHLLLGRQATLQNIRHELEVWLPSVAQPSDRVVVFFAGHGFVKNARGYLAGWDVDPDRLDSTAYPMATLGEVLARRVKAQSKVLLTDACHSGKINTETTNESLEAQFSGLPPSFLTLTATTEREQSYEDPTLSTGFGLFTYYLAEAWNGGADNDPCDGRITADEMIEYVRSRVRRYAKERRLSQTPTARGDYDPAMVLGVAAGCTDSDAASVPSMLGTAVVDVNLDEVDLYIDGQLVGKVATGKPLVVPRLSSGLHEFTGVKAGFEPDRRQVMMAPGQEALVKLRIRRVREVKTSAIGLVAEGERLLYTQRSTVNPLNILPVERSQSDDDLRRARDLFAQALAEDPGFSKAAFNLGQANQLLSDADGSLAAFKRAIEIDPSYVDARSQYAAVLIESGDPEQAIRELTESLRLDGSNDELHAMLARAYWDKGVWQQAADTASRAIELNASNAQAHLWQADALRQLAALEADRSRREPLYAASREGYRTFLRLTNFSSGFFSRLAFHVIGHGIGSRSHADREGAYKSLRNAGFLGLCITEQKVGNARRAREYCERARKYAPNDPITYFLLGNINRDLYNLYESCGDLVAARRHYTKMLELNANLVEAKNARNYLEQIVGILPKLGCRGT
jgi:tetratricopeptide (TPR) repeat protein